MTRTTSLELSKLLAGGSRPLTTVKTDLFWNEKDKRLYYRFDRAMVSFSEQVLIKKSLFGDEEWYPAYLLSELPAVLEEVGRNRWNGCTTVEDENGNGKNCGGEPLVPNENDKTQLKWKCPKCDAWYREQYPNKVLSRSHFLRFCTTFANGHNAESWKAAERELMAVVK